MRYLEPNSSVFMHMGNVRIWMAAFEKSKQVPRKKSHMWAELAEDILFCSYFLDDKF
jgi:hypothetical protein